MQTYEVTYTKGRAMITVTVDVLGLQDLMAAAFIELSKQVKEPTEWDFYSDEEV